MVKRIAVLLALIAGAGAALAQAPARSNAVEMTCPIDGSRFKYQPAPPNPSNELFLDMRPATRGGLDWPLAKCPGNGFVLFDGYTQDKLPTLRPIVQSDAYRAAANVHSTHYLAAQLMNYSAMPAYDVAWSLVRATWEVSADPAKYSQYAKDALSVYESLGPTKDIPRRQRVIKEMISGELERRLGQFDDAKKRFSSIRDEAEFTTPVLQRVIQLQLKLIAAKDSGIHRMPN